MENELEAQYQKVRDELLMRDKERDAEKSQYKNFII